MSVRRAALLVIVFVFLLPSIASAAQTHVVQLGETLWTIAAAHGISVQVLAAANDLPNAYTVRFRQELLIPERVPPALESRRSSAVLPRVRSAHSSNRAQTRVTIDAAVPGEIVYAVRSGDTLWSIASRQGTSIHALTTANNLTDPDALRLGQRLRIPRGGAPSASSLRTKAALFSLPAMIGQSVAPSRGAKWGSSLIHSIQRVVGTPYRWGGSTPRGFDCSGFIRYAMDSVGVEVPRTIAAMWSAGKPVPRDQLRVGDIVFYQTTRPGASHAGIYVGNDLFVHAASGFGRVRVTSMKFSYYTTRYLGARRF